MIEERAELYGAATPQALAAETYENYKRFVNPPLARVMKLSGSPVEVRAQRMRRSGIKTAKPISISPAVTASLRWAIASARRRSRARATRTHRALRQDDVQRDARTRGATARRACARRSCRSRSGATAEPRRSKARSNSRAPRPAARRSSARSTRITARRSARSRSAGAKRFRRRFVRCSPIRSRMPYGEAERCSTTRCRRRRVRRRAGARRGRRKRSAARVSAGGARGVRSHRRALHRRRGADRTRALRLPLRLRPRRRGARRHDAREGTLRRRRSGRRVHRAPRRLESRVRQSAAAAHVDVRRRRTRVRRRARRDGRARRRRARASVRAIAANELLRRRARDRRRVSRRSSREARGLGLLVGVELDARRVRRVDHPGDAQGRRYRGLDAQSAARHSSRAAAGRHARRRSTARWRRCAPASRRRTKSSASSVIRRAMPYVESRIVIDAPARVVYELAKDQERFPQFMPDVETVTILERRPDGVISRWKTLVEEAPIEWTEEDRFDDAALRIDYKLIEGDLDKFEGAWTFEHRDGANARRARRGLRFRRADARRADRSDAGEEGARKQRDDAGRAQTASRERMNKFLLRHPSALVAGHRALRARREGQRRADPAQDHGVDAAVRGGARHRRAHARRSRDRRLVRRGHAPAAAGRRFSARRGLQRKVLGAIEIGAQLGAQVAGLGAFTGVVGDAGITINERSPIPVTTGNSLTIAAGVQSSFAARARDGRRCRVVHGRGDRRDGFDRCRLRAADRAESGAADPRRAQRDAVAQVSRGDRRATLPCASEIHDRRRRRRAASAADSDRDELDARRHRARRSCRPARSSASSRCRTTSAAASRDERPDVLVVEGGNMRVPGQSALRARARARNRVRLEPAGRAPRSRA